MRGKQFTPRYCTYYHRGGVLMLVVGPRQLIPTPRRRMGMSLGGGSEGTYGHKMQEVYVGSRGIAGSRYIWWHFLAVLRRVASGTCDPILITTRKKTKYWDIKGCGIRRGGGGDLQYTNIPAKKERRTYLCTSLGAGWTKPPCLF